ncbi:MAG: hypothetical protein CW348_15680 [Thermobifida sp.]|uniref:SCO3933 family regulatory protein n=1 Tax=Thermobifida sp. TaxID=2027107 RepID=UPI00257AE755|nr:hypothetical protein [Thermobifida sp.]MBO2531255.1 hypothetical protein [Thermobifida sp.]
MRSIPVDVSRMVFIAAGPVRPKLVNRQTGELKTNAQGVQLWQVKVLAQVDEQDGEALLISFPAQSPPHLRLGMPLRVSGLTAIPWEASGRHGVAFSAESVEVLRMAQEVV